MTVVDLKERLLDGDVYSYPWVPTKNMWVDMITNEIKLLPSLDHLW